MYKCNVIITFLAELELFISEIQYCTCTTGLQGFEILFAAVRTKLVSFITFT